MHILYPGAIFLSLSHIYTHAHTYTHSFLNPPSFLFFLLYFFPKSTHVAAHLCSWRQLWQSVRSGSQAGVAEGPCGTWGCGTFSSTHWHSQQHRECRITAECVGAGRESVRGLNASTMIPCAMQGMLLGQERCLGAECWTGCAGAGQGEITPKE